MKKGFIECLTDFMGDSEGQTKEEVVNELEEMGIDTDKLMELVDKLLAIKRRRDAKHTD
jgi:hypothetical protein